MYTDDTVLLAESADGLQRLLDSLYIYIYIVTNEALLLIATTTKIVVF